MRLLIEPVGRIDAGTDPLPYIVLITTKVKACLTNTVNTDTICNLRGRIQARALTVPMIYITYLPNVHGFRLWRCAKETMYGQKPKRLRALFYLTWLLIGERFLWWLKWFVTWHKAVGQVLSQPEIINKLLKTLRKWKRVVFRPMNRMHRDVVVKPPCKPLLARAYMWWQRPGYPVEADTWEGCSYLGTREIWSAYSV